MSLLRYTNSRRPTVMTDHESLPANTPGLPYVGVTSHVLLCELLDEHNRPAPTPPGSSVDRDDDPVVWFVAHPIVAIRVVTPALASELGEVLGRLVDAPAV